jgi:transketolase
MSPSGVLQRQRPAERVELRRRANWIRRQTLDLAEIARSGHYSSTFSCAELFAVLYYRTLRLDPGRPDWPERDRFLLGKGHAAIGLYPCLADLGYFPSEWLSSYTRLGSPLGDHPDMRKVPGIDFSSGSIGHNLSVATGMALAARMSGLDFRTIVLLGDGELHEGQVWEAAMAASHFTLGNLVAIVDYNRLTLDGPVSDVMGVEPMANKWQAFGWDVVEVDGHDVERIVEVLDELPATASEGPTCVIAHTIKGKGIDFMEGSADWHLGFLAGRDKDLAVAQLESSGL